MSDFTKLTIFVTRIKNNKQVWKARAEFFKDNFPACSLVELSNLAEPNIYVEIEGIAHIGKGPFLINHRGSIYYYFINFRLNCRPKNYYYKKYNKNR